MKGSTGRFLPSSVAHSSLVVGTKTSSPLQLECQKVHPIHRTANAIQRKNSPRRQRPAIGVTASPVYKTETISQGIHGPPQVTGNCHCPTLILTWRNIEHEGGREHGERAVIRRVSLRSDEVGVVMRSGITSATGTAIVIVLAFGFTESAGAGDIETCEKGNGQCGDRGVLPRDCFQNPERSRSGNCLQQSRR
jgi:hypothetical protein